MAYEAQKHEILKTWANWRASIEIIKEELCGRKAGWHELKCWGNEVENLDRRECALDLDVEMGGGRLWVLSRAEDSVGLLL